MYTVSLKICLNHARDLWTTRKLQFIVIFCLQHLIDWVRMHVFKQISFFSPIALGLPESHEMHCKLKMLEIKIFLSTLQVLSFYRSLVHLLNQVYLLSMNFFLFLSLQVCFSSAHFVQVQFPMKIVKRIWQQKTALRARFVFRQMWSLRKEISQKFFFQKDVLENPFVMHTAKETLGNAKQGKHKDIQWTAVESVASMAMNVTRKIFWISQLTKASALFAVEIFYKKAYLHASNILIVGI